MTEHIAYLAKYKPDTLYVHPSKDRKGAYATLVGDNEVLLGEIEVTTRARLAISAFYVNEKEDFNSFKITKLKFHQTHGWQPDGEVKLNNFQISKFKEFISLLATLDLKDTDKTKISLGDVHVDVLETILRSDSGANILQQIAENPGLSEDIFALAHKKRELEVFRKLLTEYDTYKDEYVSSHSLTNKTEEGIWQNFFERNPWIFGHGLNYIFLGKDGQKLEATTTGFSHTNAGNRVDALMHTKAVISQYVLIEIKKPTSDLLQSREYRSGCWSASTELAGAVSQIQKTVFDFTSNAIAKTQVKSADGRNTGNEIYRVQPRSYLVIGNLEQLKDHDEKFTCFQLFRSSLNNPEILTYDELYERAKCIVDTISRPEAV